MTLPATAQEIYDLLVGDEAISDALGTYTLPGGGVVPAISVLADGEDLPSGTMTGGLEITITAVPGYGPQALLTFETLLRPTWRIYVIAWGALGGMQAVVERVIALLPGATASSITGDAPGEGIGVIDQTVITWMNPCAVIEA
jgi:hypothetical protein